MDIREMKDTYTGKMVRVDWDSRRLYAFDNEKRKAVWTCKEADSNSYASVSTEEVIEDVERKLETWANPVSFAYAVMVDFHASMNDPEKKLWTKVVESVKLHPSRYFTKCGNWRKGIKVEQVKHDVSD